MASRISPSNFSTLIGSIYDCALDPQGWQRTLTDVAGALGSHTVALHLNDLRHNEILFHVQAGEWLVPDERYMADMHALLPRVPALDEPFVLSRHVDPEVARRSPFVQEWCRPRELADLMQLFLMHDAVRLSGFGAAWTDRHGAITDDEFELARLLLPHLRRAVLISDVLDMQTIERKRIAETLDELRCGVVLTDAQSAIVHANRSAEEMMRNGGPISGAGGMLHAMDAQASNELRQAIRRATQPISEVRENGFPTRLTAPQTAARFAHVLPLTGGEYRTRLRPEAIAAVFIGVSDEPGDARAMAAAYRLTPAETRVLVSVLAGSTVAQAAGALGIAESTAKTHLGKIFAKTGVSRQADLVRLSAGLSAPVRKI
jgi:DNA-binding CsgD family transcriptional regulator/PAS domain-containing protein